MGVHDEGENEGSSCAMGLEAETVDERYLHGLAEIPDYREQVDPEREYRDFPEEKIWSPKEEVNEWVSLYVFMARSVLTFVQESRGIPNREAMENSCTGYAEQYITDVLHDSEYVPEVALKTLLTKELPSKLVARWSTADTDLFLKGIARHGKNFANIQKDMLPQKNTKDIVDFYYAWKWSEPAKELRNCRRRRRHPRSKRRFPSIGFVFGQLMSPRILTRSASKELSPKKDEESARAASSPENTTFVTRRKRRSSHVVR